MNSYEAIRDRYEDALLERMMEAVRTAQGQAALAENERLRADPGAAAPRSLDEQCRQIIKQGYRKGQLHRAGRRTLRVIRQVAIIAAVLILCFVVAYACSAAVRSETNKWILGSWVVNTFKDRTEITSTVEAGEDQAYRDENGTLLMSHLTLRANWVPDGFAVDKEGENLGAKWLHYKSKNRYDELDVRIVYVIGGTDILDTEDSTISSIEISGHEATVISKNNGSHHIVFWILEEYGAHVVVVGKSVTVEETIKFAQNLVIE